MAVLCSFGRRSQSRGMSNILRSFYRTVLFSGSGDWGLALGFVLVLCATFHYLQQSEVVSPGLMGAHCCSGDNDACFLFHMVRRDFCCNALAFMLLCVVFQAVFSFSFRPVLFVGPGDWAPIVGFCTSLLFGCTSSSIVRGCSSWLDWRALLFWG